MKSLAVLAPNPAVNRTLRDKATQRRSRKRWTDEAIWAEVLDGSPR